VSAASAAILEFIDTDILPLKLQSKAERIQTRLLKSDSALEPASDHQQIVDEPERQCGELPWCRAADDPGRITWIKLRLVTGTLETILLCVPFGHVTTGVRAYPGICDDTVGSSCTRLLGKGFRVKSHEDYLVEPRTVPDDFAHRVLSPCKYLLRTDDEIIRSNDLILPIAEGKHEHIAFDGWLQSGG